MPDIDKTTDEVCRDMIKKNKKASLLILLCWLVYTCSYIGKLGYNANITQIEAFYGVSHAQTGMATTFFFFAYGLGQIINGAFCKKYNIRFVVFGSLLISGLMNLFIAFVDTFETLKYLWMINGAALSILWTSLIRLLSENLDEKYMARAVVIMGTTVASGTFLVYGFSALFVALSAFRMIFYFAAILLPIVAIVWMIGYFLLIPKQRCDNALSIVCAEKNASKSRGNCINSVGGIIAILAFYAVIDNLVKDGLTTWVPTILKELYRIPDYVGILLTLLLPVFSIFGTMVAVALYKKIKSFVGICLLLFFCSAIFILITILCLPINAFAITLGSFSFVSCLMAGVNNVITSMMPLYYKEKLNSGMIAGILNGFCYLGSTISSYGLGCIADVWGWSTVFWTILVLTLMACCVGGVYMINKKRDNNDRV